RRCVESVPALSEGFEIETELTVHALELRMPTAEVETAYKVRPKGSASKLRTYRDGIHICWTILQLIKEERPLQFFGAIFLLLVLFSASIRVLVFITSFVSGFVSWFIILVVASALI